MLIKESAKNELVIKKSKFITHLYRVNNLGDVNDRITELKKEYHDATHICYAYIINDMKKCNNDNEPSGTAGVPILTILEKNSLNKVLAVVVRYFGGTKLGAGGLMRAYGNSIIEALNNSNIIEERENYFITIEFDISKLKIVNNILKSVDIISKDFGGNITFIFKMFLDESEEIINSLNNNNIKIIDKKICD